MYRPTPRATLLGSAITAVLVGPLIALELPTEYGSTAVSNVVQAVAPLLAGWASIAAGRRSAGAERRAWTLLGATALAWGLGQVVWTWLSLRGSDELFPSLADAGYVAAVPLGVAAVWTMSSLRTSSARLLATVDGLIAAGALLAISWPLVLGPAWRDSSSSGLAFALGVSYPIGSIALTWMLVRVVGRSGDRTSTIPMATIALGLLLTAASDSYFLWTSLNDEETAATVMDLGWICGYLLILVAAQAAPRRAPERSPRIEHLTAFARGALPLTVACIAIGVQLWVVAKRPGADPFNRAVLIVTLSLVVVRHFMTIWDNHRLTAALQHKIIELEQREGELAHQAFHDPLTGLANRRLFTDRVDHALDRSRRTGERSAVLFIDLDEFKMVNDSLGHPAGDRLLALVGARLAGCVRAGDTVARLGGDEFGVLLEELAPDEEPGTVALRMLAALEVPFALDGRPVFARASVGIATAEPGGSDSGDVLLADADVALYEAKAAGKARVRSFEPALRIQAVDRLELSQDLHRAIRHDQLRCEYQPIVDLVSGRTVAVEALVRWEHPTRGLLGPSTFIALAEQSRVIDEIGQRVLELATGQIATWRSEGCIDADVDLHVNLSARQLESRRLVDVVALALERTGLPPERLVLELTESVAVDAAGRHAAQLDELRSTGVRLAIDDFGTGYSSLSQLRSLPVDVLKVDQFFTASITSDEEPILLEAVVKLGNALGIEVIAEGVERPEQADLLRRIGCRRAQGYHLARPSTTIPARRVSPVVSELLATVDPPTPGPEAMA